MKKWLLCVGVVLAFLFAVVPFLSAAGMTLTTDPPGDAVKPKPAETPKPVPIPKLTDEQKAKAEKLIKDLGSDDFATREAAEEALKKMGVAVLPLVKKSATSSDAEIAQRTARIVEHLKDLLPAGPSNVRITLSIDKKKYKIGERIRLTLRFANQDKKTILLPMGNTNYPWHEASNYVLTGPDGKAIEFNKGKASPLNLRRQQVVLTPGKPFTQKSFMSLIKLLPKPAPGIGQLKLRGGGARDQVKEKEKDEKAKAKAPIGFLRDSTNQYHFALATLGKYTLKFRFVAKDDKAQPRERAGVPPQAVQRRGVGVQVFVFRGQNRGRIPVDAKSVKGLMESNTVTFEVVE